MHWFRPQLARAFILVILALCYPAAGGGDEWATARAAGAAEKSTAPGPDYVPQIGQQGKDVIWVPTPESLVERMLDMTGVTARDYVIDLGAGDGRTGIAAAQRGARALVIDANP